MKMHMKVINHYKTILYLQLYQFRQTKYWSVILFKFFVKINIFKQKHWIDYSVYPSQKHRLNTYDVSIFIITNITYHQLYIHVRSLYVEYIRHKSYACWMLNNNLYTFSVLLASIIWNFGEIWYYIGILKKSNNFISYCNVFI